MELWPIVKDLLGDGQLTKVKPETVQAVLKNMTVSDWDSIKKDLKEATESNVEAKKSLELILKVLDLVIEKGINVIL